MSNDPVKHPSHYTQGGIECIEAIKASMTHQEYIGYLKGNAMKYLWRYRNKEKPVEDLLKAQTYLNWLVEEISKDTKVSNAPTSGITVKQVFPIDVVPLNYGLEATQAGHQDINGCVAALRETEEQASAVRDMMRNLND